MGNIKARKLLTNISKLAVNYRQLQAQDQKLNKKTLC